MPGERAGARETVLSAGGKVILVSEPGIPVYVDRSVLR